MGTEDTPTGSAFSELWNGTAWAILPMPVVNGTPESISCASSSFCVAVGGRGWRRYIPFAEVWNGTTWKVQPAAAPPGSSELSGVDCTSASACMAVGERSARSSFGFLVEVPLAEHWNGARWSIEPVPEPPYPYITWLAAVSCPSVTDCEAVGTDGQTPVFGPPLAVHWNGRRWAIQPAPGAEAGVADILDSVSCTSGTECAAVGGATTGPGNATPFVWRWNGHRWTRFTPPDPGGYAGLSGVSCVAASGCVAVGHGDRYPHEAALIESDVPSAPTAVS